MRLTSELPNPTGRLPLDRLESFSTDIWDAVIVGAGPAGGTAAAILGRRGWRVLLVDRSPFPRDKTCGGCVNATAVNSLREIGLGGIFRNAQPVDRFDLNVMGRRIEVLLPGGFAISRRQLDLAIVSEATKFGCTFAPGISAKLLPAQETEDFRRIRLRSELCETIVSARIVLACDGINGSLMDDEPGIAWKIARDSWFGVSMTFSPEMLESGTRAFNHLPRPGSIQMNVGRGGYVGLVRLTNDEIHLGAALDSAGCHRAGGARKLIESILAECDPSRQNPSISANLMDASFSQGKPTDCNPWVAPHSRNLNSANNPKLHGAGRLTRTRNKFGAHRVLAVGDACGYVEPFTGEGISWAFRAAREVAQLLPDPPAQWNPRLPDRWTARHRATIGRRQILCRALRQIAHRPALAGACVSITSIFPSIAGQAANWISQSPNGRSYLLLQRAPLSPSPCTQSGGSAYRGEGWGGGSSVVPQKMAAPSPNRFAASAEPIVEGAAR